MGGRGRAGNGEGGGEGERTGGKSEGQRDGWRDRRTNSPSVCVSVCLSVCHQVSLCQLFPVYLLSINFCIQKSMVHSPPLSTTFSEDQMVASTLWGEGGEGGGEGGEGGGKDTCHVSCVGSRYNQLLPVHSGHSQQLL